MYAKHLDSEIITQVHLRHYQAKSELNHRTLAPYVPAIPVAVAYLYQSVQVLADYRIYPKYSDCSSLPNYKTSILLPVDVSKILLGRMQTV